MWCKSLSSYEFPKAEVHSLLGSKSLMARQEYACTRAQGPRRKGLWCKSLIRCQFARIAAHTLLDPRWFVARDTHGRTPAQGPRRKACC